MVGAHGRKASAVFAARPGDAVGGEHGYDAFISYSHQADHDLAVGLQVALQRFAKRWYQRRALRVFRDEASLTANPALWESIEQALSASKWFVILASATGARSEWVNREIGWWLANRSPERLLIVATSPGLVWDTQSGDWAADAPVPPALRRVLADEPRVADLVEVAHSNERPKLPDDAVADIAAPIHGKPKDELVGDHVREHRRTRRLARGAVLGLSILTAAAVFASVIATGQRNNARNQTQVALSRQLAAASGSVLSTNLDMALLLAVQGYQTNRNAQTLAALMRADTSSPQLVRYVPTGASVSQLAASGDGSTVAAGLADGRVLRWTLASPRPHLIFGLPARISSLAVSRNGSIVAASDGAGAKLWRHGRSVAGLSVPAGQKADVVALSPSGRTVVVHGAPSVGDGAGSIVIFSVPRMTVTSVHSDPLYSLARTNDIVVPSDDQVVLFDLGYGTWERRTIRGWSFQGGSSALLGTHQAAGIPAADGEYFTATNGDGTIPVWRTRGKTSNSDPGFTAQAPLSGVGFPSASALSPDGTSLALAENGVIHVAPVRRAGTPRAQAIQLTGTQNISSVSFLGNDHEVISASGDIVAEWDLKRVGRLARVVPTKVHLSCDACLGPSVVISPDSTLAGIVSGDGGSQAVIQPLPPARGGMQQTPGDYFEYLYGPPVWDGKQHLVVPVSPPPGGSNVVAPSSVPSRFSVWAGGNKTDPVMATGLSGTRARAIIVVDSRGRIYLQDAVTGSVLKTIPGPVDLESGDNSLQATAVHSSPDLVAMIDNGSARIVDPDNGRTVGQIPGSDVSWVAFSGSHLLVQRKDNSLEVWDARGTALERTLPAEQSYGPPVGNMQGTLIARQQTDGSIELDDLSSGAVIDTLPRFSVTSGVKQGVAFAPDGGHLIIVISGIGPGLDSAELIDLDISGAALVNAACVAAGHSLSPSEWRTFLGSDPPPDLACAGSESP